MSDTNTTETKAVIDTGLPPMFRADRKLSIDIQKLCEAAVTNVDDVQTIRIPSPVKVKRHFKEAIERPTLSEISGGPTNATFCQVVAGPDGMPVITDNVLFVTNDPANRNVNHGTACIDVGSVFSVGCKLRNGSTQVILIYEITQMREFQVTGGEPSEILERVPMTAELTCELICARTFNWRGWTGQTVPEKYKALFETTECRLRARYDYPMFLDVIKITKIADEVDDVLEKHANREYEVLDVSAESFTPTLFSEITAVRKVQYQALPASPPERRRVQPLKIVQLLNLNEDDTTMVDIAVIVVREDSDMPVVIQTTISEDKFVQSNGRQMLERGLTLNCNSFDRFRSEVEKRMASRDPKTKKFEDRALVYSLQSIF